MQNTNYRMWALKSNLAQIARFYAIAIVVTAALAAVLSFAGLSSLAWTMGMANAVAVFFTAFALNQALNAVSEYRSRVAVDRQPATG